MVELSLSRDRIARFLATGWQRQPVLFRNAVPGVDGLIDGDTLAGLACAPDIDARIVHREGPEFSVSHGPFEEEDFAALGDDGWTLLVQAVDHFIPRIADLRRRFDFLPTWRLDDVMVSFSAPGGGVGPHIDRYDVFLIQGQGRRRWTWGTRFGAEAPLRAHPDLQLLEVEPGPRREILEPGDMLYLPPGIGHEGVALDASITLSVGFRAPGVSEILTELCADLAIGYGADCRYTDPALDPTRPPAELPADALGRLRSLVLEAVDQPDRIADWFGRHMTTPTRPTSPDPERDDPAAWLASLAPGGRLQLHPACRLAYRTGPFGVRVYADGEVWQVRPEDLPAVQALHRGRLAAPVEGSPAFFDMLRDLVADGKVQSPPAAAHQ